MKKLIKRLAPSFVIVCLFSLFTGEVKASQLAGAEFSWTCVGKDSFMVTVVIYQDCSGTPIGTPYILIYCKATGQSIITLNIAKPNPVDITPVCPSNCSQCSGSGCTFAYGTQKYVCTKLAVLSNAGSCCKIAMSFQECCRPIKITTGAASQNFYTDAELDRCVSPCDHSPRFTNPPQTIICEGQDFVFNHGVVDDNVDSNGGLIDSIAYEWTQPMTGSVTYTTWLGQYAYDHPIYYWGFKNANLPFPRGLHLDPNTGDISFRPMKVEQTVMSIKVSQWRKINGKMTNIGFVKRDLYVIVISCPANTQPTLTGPFYKEVYAGDTVSFQIATYDSDTLVISWNNAIQEANWSDNNGTVKHPTGNLTWVPGKTQISTIPYMFTATVQDEKCPLNGRATRAYQILVIPKPEGKLRFSKTSCDTFLLEAFDLENVKSVKWYENNMLLSSLNPFSYHITKPGKHIIKLELSGRGYPIYLYDTLDLSDFIDANLPNDTILCKGDSIFINSNVLNAQGTVKYKWSTGDTTSFIQLPPLYYDTYVYLEVQDTVYCHTDSMLIKVDQFDASISQASIPCPGDSSVLHVAPLFDEGKQVKTYFWLDLSCACPKGFDDSIQIYEKGVFTCKLVNELGCTVTDTFVAKYHEKPQITLTTIPDKCLNEADFSLYDFALPKGGNWYGQDTGIVKNNVFLLSKAIAKPYMIFYKYIEYPTGCSDTDRITFNVKDFPKIKLLKPIRYCDEDRLIDLSDYILPVNGNWDTLHPAIINAHYFNPHLAALVSYPLIYHVDSTNGCSNELKVDYHINPAPVVNFEVDVKQGNIPLEVQFNNLSSISNGILSYLWYFGDGDSSMLEHPSHTYLRKGQFDVKLIAVSDSLCMAEKLKTQYIEVFSSMNESVLSGDILVYPNPAQDKLIIESAEKLNRVILYNFIGAKIREFEPIDQVKLVVERGKLPSGLYLLKIYDKNEDLYVFQVVFK